MVQVSVEICQFGSLFWGDAAVLERFNMIVLKISIIKFMKTIQNVTILAKTLHDCIIWYKNNTLINDIMKNNSPLPPDKPPSTATASFPLLST